MRKTYSFLIIFALFFVAQGCATADRDKKALHTRSMEQAVERNNIVLSEWCGNARVRAIIAAKYEAGQYGESARNWPKYYRVPSCVLGEQNTWRKKRAEIPKEFGFSLADLAKLDYDELCEKSPLKRMGTSRGMVWLAEQGIPTEFYRDISEECIRRDDQKTRRKFYWNRLFYRISPRVGYDYGFGAGNYEYRTGYYSSNSSRNGYVTTHDYCPSCGPSRTRLIRRANGGK